MERELLVRRQKKTLKTLSVEGNSPSAIEIKTWGTLTMED
tara:strand:+ start:608 stop:727 length:120 start_codon:yes stop_codon:yes gene_type:complete